jgi:hypothetical protein
MTSDEREEDEIVMHGAVVIAEAGEIVRSGASACAKRASSGSEQRVDVDRCSLDVVAAVELRLGFRVPQSIPTSALLPGLDSQTVSTADPRTNHNEI